MVTSRIILKQQEQEQFSREEMMDEKKRQADEKMEDNIKEWTSPSYISSQRAVVEDRSNG